MRRFVTLHLVASLLSLGIAAWPMLADDATEPAAHPIESPGAADDRSGGDLATSPASNRPTDRTIYFPRNVSAQSLHALIEKHFEGDDRVRFVVEPVSNFLSIRATSAAAIEAVLGTLSQIDKPLRTVDVTIFLIEFPSRDKDTAASGEPAQQPVDLESLSGTAAETVRQVQHWMKNGQVTSLRRFEMRTLENMPSQLLLGEQKPVTSGVVKSGRIGDSPVVTIRDVGISFDVTSRIMETGDISLALVIRDTQLESTDRGVELGEGENGPIVVPTIATRHLSTSLSVANGQTSIATAFEPGPDSGHRNARIVVSARIVDSGSRTTGPVPGTPAAFEGQPEGLMTNRPPFRGAGAGFGDSRGGPPDPQRDRRRRISTRTLYISLQNEAFLSQLALSEEQQNRIENLRSETLAKLRSMGPPGQFGTRNPAELSNAFRQFEEEAAKILTEQQLKTWEDWKEGNVSERRESPGRTPLPPTRPPNE